MPLRFILLLLITSLSSHAYNLKAIRLEYYEAVKNEKIADNLYKKLKASPSKDAIILAYFGATEAVRAKHAFNPYNKVAYLKSGLKNLAKAVDASPNSLEIRFLRFSLEYYVPGFLGMSKHIDTDRKKIVELISKESFGTVDTELLKNIISFMKETKKCSEAEIGILNKALNG